MEIVVSECLKILFFLAPPPPKRGIFAPLALEKEKGLRFWHGQEDGNLGVFEELHRLERHLC